VAIHGISRLGEKLGSIYEESDGQDDDVQYQQNDP
jgi:hypothetical protein